MLGSLLWLQPAKRTGHPRVMLALSHHGPAAGGWTSCVPGRTCPLHSSRPWPLVSRAPTPACYNS